MQRQAPHLVVALDNCTPDQARVLVHELSDAGVRWFKVGLELFTLAGPDFIARLKSDGQSVFLDLKLYDIPNTVAKAVTAAAVTGADLLTVHCSGGPVMLEAARRAADGSQLSLLGVTVLTSFGAADFSAVCQAWGARNGSDVPRAAVALRLAEHAAAAGFPGIVCSASDLRDGELRKLAWRSGPPLFVTPGIREPDNGPVPKSDDQTSVATAEQAVLAGSTHLVVGRPITAQPAGARASAVRKFLKQIKEAYGLASHS